MREGGQFGCDHDGIARPPCRAVPCRPTPARVPFVPFLPPRPPSCRGREKKRSARARAYVPLPYRDSCTRRAAAAATFSAPLLRLSPTSPPPPPGCLWHGHRHTHPAATSRAPARPYPVTSTTQVFFFTQTRPISPAAPARSRPRRGGGLRVRAWNFVRCGLPQPAACAGSGPRGGIPCALARRVGGAGSIRRTIRCVVPARCGACKRDGEMGWVGVVAGQGGDGDMVIS